MALFGQNLARGPLRSQVKTLERDRSQTPAQEQQVDSEEVEQLKEDNGRLQKALRSTQARLNSIQRLLDGGNLATEAPAEEEETDEDSDTSKQRDRSESTAKIADVIDALIQWNNDQQRNDLRLRISFPVIKSLALLVGAGYQAAIKEVVDGEKGKAIDAVHQHYIITSRHNRSVQNKDKVLQEIAKDYLELPNWKDAKYTT